MRIILLPLTTRHTLLYCDRGSSQALGTANPDLITKATDRAGKLWSDWERSETSWKRRLTEQGNRLLNRLSYEEWGLKTVPPLRKSSSSASDDDVKAVAVVYPGAFLGRDRAASALRSLAVDKQPFHRRRMWWSLLGIPAVAPLAVVPVVPNIPFFYLAFRAWSHWRALGGAQHLQSLLSADKFIYKPSDELDSIYRHNGVEQIKDSMQELDGAVNKSQDELSLESEKDTEHSKTGLLLRRPGGKLISDHLKLPGLLIEFERAIEQLERQFTRESK